MNQKLDELDNAIKKKADEQLDELVKWLMADGSDNLEEFMNDGTHLGKLLNIFFGFKLRAFECPSTSCFAAAGKRTGGKLSILLEIKPKRWFGFKYFWCLRCQAFMRQTYKGWDVHTPRRIQDEFKRANLNPDETLKSPTDTKILVDTNDPKYKEFLRIKGLIK